MATEREEKGLRKEAACIESRSSALVCMPLSQTMLRGAPPRQAFGSLLSWLSQPVVLRSSQASTLSPAGRVGAAEGHATTLQRKSLQKVELGVARGS